METINTETKVESLPLMENFSPEKDRIEIVYEEGKPVHLAKKVMTDEDWEKELISYHMEEIASETIH
jgi:hypothetical protein